MADDTSFHPVLVKRSAVAKGTKPPLRDGNLFGSSKEERVRRDHRLKEEGVRAD